MNGHTSIVRGIAYSVDGKYLATVSNDETGQSVGRGERRGTLRGHSGFVRGVAFSPDGRRLSTASNDKAVKLWDATSVLKLLTLRGHPNWVNSVAFSPDGKPLASGSAAE